MYRIWTHTFLSPPSGSWIVPGVCADDSKGVFDDDADAEIALVALFGGGMEIGAGAGVGTVTATSLLVRFWPR